MLLKDHKHWLTNRVVWHENLRVAGLTDKLSFEDGECLVTLLEHFLEPYSSSVVLVNSVFNNPKSPVTAFLAVAECVEILRFCSESDVFTLIQANKLPR